MMATETAAAAGPDLPDRRVTERHARFSPGLRALAAGIIGLLAAAPLLVLCSAQATQPVVSTGRLYL
jgi:hypothetical protein